MRWRAGLAVIICRYNIQIKREKKRKKKTNLRPRLPILPYRIPLKLLISIRIKLHMMRRIHPIIRIPIKILLKHSIMIKFPLAMKMMSRLPQPRPFRFPFCASRALSTDDSDAYPVECCCWCCSSSCNCCSSACCCCNSSLCREEPGKRPTQCPSSSGKRQRRKRQNSRVR